LIPFSIFVAGVLAYPASWRHRFAGVALGGLAIFAVNLVRVVSLFYIGSAWRAAFDTAHFLVWQSAIILLVVALLIAWIERLPHAPSP
jgi:exosortase/archaeosortase family protein